VARQLRGNTCSQMSFRLLMYAHDKCDAEHAGLRISLLASIRVGLGLCRLTLGATCQAISC
jgi:hypothetical protein